MTIDEGNFLTGKRRNYGERTFEATLPVQTRNKLNGKGTLMAKLFRNQNSDPECKREGTSVKRAFS